MNTIQNIIKNTSPSQECSLFHQCNVFHAFKFNRCQLNLKPSAHGEYVKRFIISSNVIDH